MLQRSKKNQKGFERKGMVEKKVPSQREVQTNILPLIYITLLVTFKWSIIVHFGQVLSKRCVDVLRITQELKVLES